MPQPHQFEGPLKDLNEDMQQISAEDCFHIGTGQ